MSVKYLVMMSHGESWRVPNFLWITRLLGESESYDSFSSSTRQNNQRQLDSKFFIHQKILAAGILCITRTTYGIYTLLYSVDVGYRVRQKYWTGLPWKWVAPGPTFLTGFVQDGAHTRLWFGCAQLVDCGISKSKSAQPRTRNQNLGARPS